MPRLPGGDASSRSSPDRELDSLRCMITAVRAPGSPWIEQRTSRHQHFSSHAYARNQAALDMAV